MSKKVSKEEIGRAFRKTIDRWQEIVKDPGYHEKSYCHLCTLENDEGDEEMRGCNKWCPIRYYNGGLHGGCCDTPYFTFTNHKTKENAKAELDFLCEVYLDFLENQIQEQLGELNRAIKEETREAEEKKEEWVGVTEELTAKVYMITEHQGYIRLYHNGRYVAFTKSDHEIKGLELVLNHQDYKIETKGGDFTVFKRRER